MVGAGAVAQFSRPAPICLGFVGPLSGSSQELGQAGRDGTMLAVEECNDGGGIQGHLVQLLIRDDGGDTTQLGMAMASLAAAGAQAAVGPMTNESAIFGSAYSQQHNIVMVSPTASADELTGRDDLFFRLYPASEQVMDHLARHMHARRGLQRPAILVDEAVGSYAAQMGSNFSRAYTLAGHAPSGLFRFDSADPASLSATVALLAASKPDSVFIVADPQQTAMACQYLRQAGLQVPVATTERAAGDDLIAYGGSAVEGLFFYHTFDRNYPSERYESFRQRFRRRFGHQPGFAAVHAYDSARIILTAIAEKQPRTDLRVALSEIRYFEGVQGRIAISEAGDVRRELFLVTVRNGVLRAME